MSTKPNQRETRQHLLWRASRNAVPKLAIGYVSRKQDVVTIRQQADAVKENLGVAAISGDGNLTVLAGTAVASTLLY